MKDPVATSIEYMWEHLDEEITLDDMAAAALFSRFYFSRVFLSATGTSPGRFLTAIRIARSKTILATTDFSVSEVAASVGYDSLGTFTTRFSKTVGISPALFRKYARNPASIKQVTYRQTGPIGPGTGARLTGTLEVSRPLPYDRSIAGCRTYVAAFRSPIVQGAPWACEVVDGLTYWRLLNLPDGDWHVRAITVARTVKGEPPRRKPLLVGDTGRIRIRGGGTIQATLRMREPAVTDPPTLLLIPELDCVTERSFLRGSPVPAAARSHATDEQYSSRRRA